jgi:hypothetical protein
VHGTAGAGWGGGFDRLGQKEGEEGVVGASWATGPCGEGQKGRVSWAAGEDLDPKAREGKRSDFPFF